MQYTVSEIAKLTGVSVRTLHYYDEIHLLSPSQVSEAGYRYYDEAALAHLQQILFYRELDFNLKTIANIMNAPNYRKEEALEKQKQLLLLKRQRLDNIITLLDANLKGESNMSFKEFDTTKIEQEKAKYAAEVKEKWGDTMAYQESQEKTKSYSKDDWNQVMSGMDDLLKNFAANVNEAPDSKVVQELVGQWQQFITDHYYNCTKEILKGLGQMYVADERFTSYMDKFATGTASLVSQGIEVYCK